MWRAGHELDPRRVGLTMDLARGPGTGIDVEHGEGPLVACLHHEGRVRSRAPARVAQVLEFAAHPVDIDARAIEPHDREGDAGIVGARLRVPNRMRLDPRIDWRADPPGRDRRRVDTRREQVLTCGAPPETSRAMHLLGGDELGRAPRDVPIVLTHHEAIAVRIEHTQARPGNVRDT